MTNKPIVILTGPPCSGKTTYIDNHKDPQDIVIDLDRIAHALGYPTEHIDFNTKHPAKDAALIARASLIKRAPFPNTTTWIIDTRNTHHHPKAEHINLDPGPDECHHRADADGRSPTTHKQIDHWYTTQPTQPTRQW